MIKERYSLYVSRAPAYYCLQWSAINNTEYFIEAYITYITYDHFILVQTVFCCFSPSASRLAFCALSCDSQTLGQDSKMGYHRFLLGYQKKFSSRFQVFLYVYKHHQIIVNRKEA